MKKIILLNILLTILSASVKAQTEVTPDMIWREGVIFIRDYKEVWIELDDEDNFIRFDTIKSGPVRYELTTVTVGDEKYLVDKNIPYGWFDISYRREDNGKIFCYKFHTTWDASDYAENGDSDEITKDSDGNMGKEYMAHDFNTWAEAATVEWTGVYGISFNFDLKCYTDKEYIEKLEKIVSPDGKYWIWAYKYRNLWRVKGLGSISGNNSTFNDILGDSDYHNDKLYSTGERLLEVRSPEGEIYFRHPDYTPDDELGAIASVVQDNGVDITCNAGEVSVTAAVPTDVVIFTAQGTKVYGASAVKHTTCKLQQGLYIVRAGSTAKKVVVK
ncbi:MAG: hypothetical protein K2M94_01220 [Paramuribaculum sp.]|nr:hypothetical protein [Paramuribaculum sp.]